MRRKCSWRVPERMAERVAGIGARDPEDEQALVSAVSYDDPRVAGVPIPLERDRVTVVVACVEFHEHDWLLSGFALRQGRERHLTASRMRVLVRDRARRMPWVLLLG